MSQTRHDDILVRTLSVRYSAGLVLEGHTHSWHQLLYAFDGVMNVETSAGTWIVPPQRAVWVPADCEHAITMCGPVDLRTVYLHPDLVREARSVSVLSITPLVRELVLHVVAKGMLRATPEADARLAGVLVDLVAAIEGTPFWVPMPRDPRARKVAENLRSDPANRDTLERIAKRAGASARTLERLFATETGMSFGRWRNQLRLLHATRQLGAGEPVTSVALDVGYESPSAFIAAFRATFGVTPGRYFSSADTR
jgi:AraC-like DNA-binding protein